MVVQSRPTPQSSKRLKWGILFALAVTILYTAGWFYLASRAKERVEQELVSAANHENTLIACEKITAHGYPFSLYIRCSDVSYNDRDKTRLVTASALNIGTSLLSMRTVQSQITGPATIAMPGFEPLQAEWEKLQTSARIAGKTAHDISLTAEKLLLKHVANNNSAINKTALELLSLQFDLQSVDAPLNVKITFDDLRLTGNPSLPVLPELDGVINISSPDSLVSFSQPDENGSLLRGKSLQLNQMVLLLPSGASLSLSGPASVDAQGIANADLKIRLTNPAAIGTVLKTAFPAQAKTINTIIFALGSLPKDETGATIVPVVVRDGKASAGFIPLGRVPLL